MGLDIQQVRRDFPILKQKVYNKPLVYLDNGATTQKPLVVTETLNELYIRQNSSIHRGIHYLSEQMTLRYEAARERVRSFLNADSTNEIIFTSGATGSINTLAYSFGEKHVGEGDEILVSGLEHHSNIVPWQMLCQRKNAKLKHIPLNDRGELILDGLNEPGGRSILNLHESGILPAGEEAHRIAAFKVTSVDFDLTLNGEVV